MRRTKPVVIAQWYQRDRPVFTVITPEKEPPLVDNPLWYAHNTGSENVTGRPPVFRPEAIAKWRERREELATLRLMGYHPDAQ